MRALVGYTYFFGGWYALKFMPIYTSSCIFFTKPIWAALMGYFLEGEPINKCDIISIFSAFCGVLVINDPLKLFEK